MVGRLADSSPQERASLLREFGASLRRHIRMEEVELFRQIGGQLDEAGGKSSAGKSTKRRERWASRSTSSGRAWSRDRRSDAPAWSAGFSRHSPPQAGGVPDLIPRMAQPAWNAGLQAAPDGAPAWNADLRSARAVLCTAHVVNATHPRNAHGLDRQAVSVAPTAWNAGFSRHSPPQAGGGPDLIPLDGAPAWNADLRSARAALRAAHVATLFGLAVPPWRTCWCGMLPARRLRQSYMFFPENRVLHVGRARATCFSPRTGYCDMYPARRLRQSYMFLPEDRLLRHVPGPPTPPELHVPPRGPATATCTRSAGPARATCSSPRTPTATCNRPTGSARATCFSPRTGYCDMYPARRLRQSYMFRPEDALLRHVTGPPAPLLLHVSRRPRRMAVSRPRASGPLCRPEVGVPGRRAVLSPAGCASTRIIGVASGGGAAPAGRSSRGAKVRTWPRNRSTGIRA